MTSATLNEKYVVKKSCILFNIVSTVIFFTLWTVIGLVLINKGICSNIILVPIIPGGLGFLYLAVSDLSAYVGLSDKSLIYHRYGRHICLNYSGIVRVEHKALLWKKGFARMMIYTHCSKYVICINTEFCNCNEACAKIIRCYEKSVEYPIVDQNLLALIAPTNT